MPVTTSKKWYKSKTLWVNALAGVVVVVQYATKTEIISPDIQTMILALVNLALRTVTTNNLTV